MAEDQEEPSEFCRENVSTSARVGETAVPLFEFTIIGLGLQPLIKPSGDRRQDRWAWGPPEPAQLPSWKRDEKLLSSWLLPSSCGNVEEHP